MAAKLKYTYKTQPYSHQKQALKKIFDLQGVGGLLMEMATGKTKVAIDWAGIGFYNFTFRRILVVAPLSVLGVWPREIWKHSSVPSRIYRLTGATSQRIHDLSYILRNPDQGKLTWIIINYEGIWRELDRGPGVEDLLKRWKPDLVIFDESHRLKNPSSKQSRSASHIALVARSRLILSGTPITKSPLDAFGQFRALDPTILGSNWHHFKYTYGIWGGFGRFQLRGYRRLPELIRKIRDHSFRIKKEQCLDLPPKLYETVPVTLPDSIIQLYKQMAEEAIIQIEDTHATGSIVLSKIIRLCQITSGFIKDVDGKIHILDDAKLNICMDLVEDALEEDHKIVIFARFLMDIERLHQKMIAAKIRHVILSGSVPGPKRDSLINQFQTDPKMKVFISQIQAGSLGIDLTAADVAIFYSLDYKADNYWQAQDRLHRPGQEGQKVIYYHLVVPKTVDAVILRVLKEKGNMAETILHKPQALLGL